MFEDDDSCFLWDVDGGHEELVRRRRRRESNASAAAVAREQVDASQNISSADEEMAGLKVSKEVKTNP